MSKTLSDEQQRALKAAYQLRADAIQVYERIGNYHKGLMSFDFRLHAPLSDSIAIEGLDIWLFFKLLGILKKLKSLNIENDFTENEAEFFDVAQKFFNKAHGIYLIFERSVFERPDWYKRRFPDAANQLREIINLIDGNSNAPEVPPGFQTKKMLIAARGEKLMSSLLRPAKTPRQKPINEAVAKIQENFKIGQAMAAAAPIAETAPSLPRKTQAPRIEAAPNWSDGATRNQLAEARDCTSQNVSKAIKRLRARNQLDGRDGKTRGRWPPEHARTIWADLTDERNTRKRKS